MLTGVLLENTLRELAKALKTVNTSPYQMLELRLDACKDFSIEEFRHLRLPLPCIFTLRNKAEGGFCSRGESDRIRLLKHLIRLKPAFLDIEASVPAETILAIRKESPETPILLSSHNFTSMPANLEAWYEHSRTAITSTADGFPAGFGDPEDRVVYKLAGTARTSLDALRMLELCKRKGKKILGIAMGPDGECTRILAPALHCGINYCPVNTPSAPGQLEAEMLRTLYNYPSINSETRFYALLGDPVVQSTGNVFHNAMNRETGENAVYVKLRVPPASLAAAVPLLHRAGFMGLSITMPHKQEILPLLADCSPEVARIGAANTLTWQPDGYYGDNTDGLGTLKALGTPLAGKTVGILGAGGSARAIIYEAAKYAKKLLIFNRTLDRQLPVDLPIHPLTDLREKTRECDILINTLPFTAGLTFPSIPFTPKMLVMDISYGSESNFLMQAELRGCRGVNGFAMFMEQAKLQRRLWNLKTAE